MHSAVISIVSHTLALNMCTWARKALTCRSIKRNTHAHSESQRSRPWCYHAHTIWATLRGHVTSWMFEKHVRLFARMVWVACEHSSVIEPHHSVMKRTCTTVKRIAVCTLYVHDETFCRSAGVQRDAPRDAPSRARRDAQYDSHWSIRKRWSDLWSSSVVVERVGRCTTHHLILALGSG